MTPEDKEYFAAMFIRILANQSLIIAALGGLMGDEATQRTLMSNADSLAYEVTMAAQALREKK